MPFGGADNTPVDVNALPATDSGIEGAEETLEQQLAKLFADNDGDVAFGNGRPSRRASVVPEEEETGAEPPAQPSEEPSPTPTPGEEGEAGEAGSEVPSGSEPAPVSTAPESPYDIIEFNGVKLTRQQANGLLSVYEWAVQNPDRAQVVDAYMRGEIDLSQPQPTAQPTQPGVQSPTGAPVDPYAGLDPALAEKIKAIETVTKYNAEELQQREAERLRAQQQEHEALASTILGEFQQRYSLTDAQREVIAQQTAQAQIIPGLMQQHRDFRAALNSALEMTFWNNPEFRAAELNRQAAAIAAQQEKQTKQSNLHGARGGVGSAPKAIDASRPVPRDKDERNKAMAADIAQALSGATN